MTNKQNPKFQELVAKLREIFQIDRPELDFGIYRILNARAGEINEYRLRAEALGLDLDIAPAEVPPANLPPTDD